MGKSRITLEYENRINARAKLNREHGVETADNHQGCFYLRLIPPEKKALEALAQDRGLTQSELLRELLRRAHAQLKARERRAYRRVS